MAGKVIISVIIAIYQAEQYLRKCLNSVLSQTMSEFELILVDDGSKDSSGAICEDYANHDKRIRVIHKENGGVASARQCGLDNAQGEYVIYVDPDDWIEPDMLETMYQEAKKNDADMVFVDYYWENQDRIIYMNEEPNDLNHFTLLEAILNQSITGATWTKLIKRSLFEKYNVRFPNINKTEDTHIMCQLLVHDIKLVHIPKAFYHYVTYINPNSLLKTIKEYRERLEAFYTLLHNHYYKYWLVYLGFRWNWLSFDILVDDLLGKADFLFFFGDLRNIDKSILMRDMNTRAKINMYIVLFALKHYRIGLCLARNSRLLTNLLR
jgi:glycosyltransferase involved in cell wall biosynthesis